MKAPKVSVIIAHSRDRSETSLSKCRYSAKKSAAFAGIDAEVIVTAEPSKSYSRNKAAKRSRGEFLVFIDDDAFATDSWIHELLKPFSDKKVGAVGGPNVVVSGAPYKEFVADLLLSSVLATGKSSSRYIPKGKIRETDESELTSCNLAVRKEVFEKVGGFPNVIPCEENALLNKIQEAGFKLIYMPLAVVHHNRPQLFRPYMKKLFYYGAGRGRFIRRNKGGVRFANFSGKTAVYFLLGLAAHWISYVSGLIWGLVRG